MNTYPSQMNASGCGCGSAKENSLPRREGLQLGARVSAAACSIAPPPPARAYCQAAPFSSPCGSNTYFKVSDAYGFSRPLGAYQQ